jgi:hypothetical protein
VIRAVFIFEDYDLSVQRSVDEAAAAVETIDVDNGEYDFFTDDGTVLAGDTAGGRVTLRPTDDRDPDELRRRLHAHLTHPRVGMDGALAEDPLRAAQAILDAEWQHRSFQWFPWLDHRLHGNGPRRV